MAHTSKKILIIEDEKPLAEALALKFRKEGFTVGVAHDGKAGFELMSGEHYDTALVDLMMPIMDGFQVLEAAQKLKNAPAMIVLSNLTQPDDVDRALNLGARKFLVKSDTPLEVLVNEVRQL